MKVFIAVIYPLAISLMLHIYLTIVIYQPNELPYAYTLVMTMLLAPLTLLLV